MSGLRMWHGAGIIFLGISVAAIAGVVAQEAQETPTVGQAVPQPATIAEGDRLYHDYCAVCHGKEGKGDGPAVPTLKTRPPDLTLLASRNKGKFDASAVQNTILGKDREFAAHGSFEMPIWGPVFRSMSDKEEVAGTRVQNLVKYIESIQVK